MKKLAFAALVLVLGGCSRNPGAGGDPSPESLPKDVPASPSAVSAVEPATGPLATNEPTPAGSTGSPTSAFASLDPALQESLGKAELASRIGDYPAAVAELKYIADSTQLTAEQRKLVEKLLVEAQKNVSEAAKHAAGRAGNQ